MISELICKVHEGRSIQFGCMEYVCRENPLLCEICLMESGHQTAHPQAILQIDNFISELLQDVNDQNEILRKNIQSSEIYDYNFNELIEKQKQQFILDIDCFQNNINQIIRQKRQNTIAFLEDQKLKLQDKIYQHDNFDLPFNNQIDTNAFKRYISKSGQDSINFLKRSVFEVEKTKKTINSYQSMIDKNNLVISIDFDHLCTETNEAIKFELNNIMKQFQMSFQNNYKQLQEVRDSTIRQQNFMKNVQKIKQDIENYQPYKEIPFRSNFSQNQSYQDQNYLQDSNQRQKNLQISITPKNKSIINSPINHQENQPFNFIMPPINLNSSPINRNNSPMNRNLTPKTNPKIFSFATLKDTGDFKQSPNNMNSSPINQQKREKHQIFSDHGIGKIKHVKSKSFVEVNENNSTLNSRNYNHREQFFDKHSYTVQKTNIIEKIKEFYCVALIVLDRNIIAYALSNQNVYIYNQQNKTFVSIIELHEDINCLLNINQTIFVGHYNGQLSQINYEKKTQDRFKMTEHPIYKMMFIQPVVFLMTTYEVLYFNTKTNTVQNLNTREPIEFMAKFQTKEKLILASKDQIFSLQINKMSIQPIFRTDKSSEITFIGSLCDKYIIVVYNKKIIKILDPQQLKILNAQQFNYEFSEILVVDSQDYLPVKLLCFTQNNLILLDSKDLSIQQTFQIWPQVPKFSIGNFQDKVVMLGQGQEGTELLVTNYSPESYYVFQKITIY